MEPRKISAGIVVNNGKILLIKRKFEPYKNFWAPPGGFTDKGISESVENCCIREIEEETGIKVEIIKKIDAVKKYNKLKNREEEIHFFLVKQLSDKMIFNNEVLDVRWFNKKDFNSIKLIPHFKKLIGKYKIL